MVEGATKTSQRQSQAVKNRKYNLYTDILDSQFHFCEVNCITLCMFYYDR